MHNPAAISSSKFAEEQTSRAVFQRVGLEATQAATYDEERSSRKLENEAERMNNVMTRIRDVQHNSQALMMPVAVAPSHQPNTEDQSYASG